VLLGKAIKQAQASGVVLMQHGDRRRIATRIQLILVCFSMATVVIDRVEAAKPPITHDVYDGWRSIRDTKLSDDGVCVVYTLAPQDRGALVPRIEFFSALRRLGKEAYMFNYSGERHGLRNRENQQALDGAHGRVLRSLPEGGATGVDGKGVPYLERERAT
jgi:hypothetical protein